MAQEPKFKRLTEEQIMQIAKLFMDAKQTVSAICDKVGVTPSQVRSAINSLKKFDVNFPEHSRETSSKYANIAEQLMASKKSSK
jgi:transposase-like protein